MVSYESSVGSYCSRVSQAEPYQLVSGSNSLDLEFLGTLCSAGPAAGRLPWAICSQGRGVIGGDEEGISWPSGLNMLWS